MDKFFAGVDLGGTRVKIGMVLGDRIIAQKVAPAPSATGLSGYLPLLQQQIEEMAAAQSLRMEALQGVGLAFPGIVNPATGKILSTNKKYDDGPSLDLKQWAADTWGVPLMIDNDARMACAGEWKYGAGRHSDDLVMMTIGTGIGTSAVIEGKLLRGKHFQAGCLGGHVSIRYNGARCPCGNKGCVELYGGSLRLPQMIEQHELYPESILKNTKQLDFASLFDAYRQGDALAALIQQQCMDAWVAGIITLVHSYDPELVILGGGVLKSADIILPYIREQVHEHSWCAWGKVDIQASQLTEDAAILGVVHGLKQLIY